MKNTGLVLGLTTSLALGVLLTASLANSTSAKPAATPDTAVLARGEYLVMRSGLCIDCHSPRNERGEFVAGQHLQGAPIGFNPLHPMPWAGVAPRLAGLPAGYSEQDLVHFLMTGERNQGRGQPLPPMPAYRFDQADAEAITAYLRSLPAK